MSKNDQNPFELLGLTPTFNVDLAALDQSYFARQAKVHPDRFVYHTEPERQAALQQASNLNQAYEALKNPVSRAQILLKLRGIEVSFEEGKTINNSDILEEMMDLQEAVSQAMSPKELADVYQKIQHRFEGTMISFTHALDQDQNQILPKIFLRLTYLSKLSRDLKSRQRQSSAKVL